MEISELLLKNVCADLIAEAVSTAKELYNGVFPLVDVPTMWMEPQEGGGYRGEPKATTKLDLGRTWALNRDKLASGPKWIEAEEVVERYQKENGTAPDQSWNLQGVLCDQIVINYLSQVDTFQLHEHSVESVCEALLAYCNSTKDIFKSTAALEGFKAREAIQLADEAVIRPVTPEELAELGQEHPLLSARRYDFEGIHPRSDWWICEITQSGTKGTPQTWNKLHQIFPFVGPCLRLFKGGQCKMDTVRIANAGPFGSGMYGSGGRATVLCRRGSPYSLTTEEVTKLQQFWPAFLELMNLEKHYLQLPARRLQFGGERTRLEDSLIDYMVGLESLLGKQNERTEMGYRMAMRGAMVLSSGSADRYSRFRKLLDLYNLRSKIVHGENLESNELSDSVDLAEEALRTCWHWFFTNWSEDSNNINAIDQIDSRVFTQDN